MNQLAIGAFVPFVVFAAWYAWRGFRAGLFALTLVPLAMAASALWAVAPDLPRLLGMYKLYFRLAADPRMDIFYWHYTIDRVEIDSAWYLPAAVVMATALLVAAWRELARSENNP